VAVNCGGLADSLVESELFGYRKGAFTGAEADHVGYFEAANGGTLFLDEIGNLPFTSQAVLLRAIEQRAIIRVGESRPRPVHIRIIAATNRDLDKCIERGEFREDLFYRLNVIRITVPALRDRRQDVPLLIDHFVDKYNAELNTRCPGFTPEALEAMTRYPWRGNVRELENVVERALIFAEGRPVGVPDLSFDLAQCASAGEEFLADLRKATREFERQHISRVLAMHDNNKVEAAHAMGIGLSSLYRKLEELEISKETPTEAPAS
jgi:transcriptional regulator with PAS, ATPase and Fis domain